MQPQVARVCVGLLVLALGGLEAAPATSPDQAMDDQLDDDEDAFTLRIIHTNDMHSRFEEVSRDAGVCSAEEAAAGRCYGGFARLASLVRAARAEASPRRPLLFLNAGDTYQGSRLFSHYKWRVVSRFLNLLRPDAVSLGNHEFDEGVDGLTPYLRAAEFPVLAANLDWAAEPGLAGLSGLRPSWSTRLGGRLVGLVGYLTPETALLARTGRVRFGDEVEAVRREAARLRAEGCQLVIALGHSGLEVDRRIAREVEHVDLVIGGHSNSFLYSGAPPDREAPEGLYPMPVRQPGGRTVYVVQAYAYTKYLGELRVRLDAAGRVARVWGSPVLLDSRVPKAPDVEAELRRWLEPLLALGSRPLGASRVLLDGDEKDCRLRECNLGNLLADAMVHHNARLYRGKQRWTDVAVAVYQAGGIRASINAASDRQVTMDDVLTSFPFGTKIYRVTLPGAKLWAMLEWSVHDRISPNVTVHGGAFLQLSGLQVVYDLSAPINSRVVSARVRCSLCEVPTYQDLDLEASYAILTNDFMYGGGDGFSMLSGLDFKDLNVTIADVVAQYINQTSPVYPGIEGRIRFVNATRGPPSPRLKSNSAQVQRLSIGLLLLKSLAFVRLF